jgi:hypothetical protein
MKSEMKETPQQMLELLEITCRETTSALSDIDPQRIVHDGEAPWRVRDVIGHIGAWNGEAAQALRAHAGDGAYQCVSSEEQYDEYNGLAVAERQTWTVEQVWEEYRATHGQLKALVEGMPDENWGREMLYPWNAPGSTWRLIKIMMRHEQEHREAILAG